jgi:hypothetical protein
LRPTEVALVPCTKNQFVFTILAAIMQFQDIVRDESDRETAIVRDVSDHETAQSYGLNHEP